MVTIANDKHKETAARIFNVPIDEVTPEQRRYAKTVNFSMDYSNTDSLEKLLKRDPCEQIAREEGYSVVESILWPGKFWWCNHQGKVGKYCESRNEAWKDCCTENDLKEN